jgi:hypothetical protein
MTEPPSDEVSRLSLIEREKTLSAERMRRQDAAGWTRGAHIPGTSIDWRVEALALEAQLAGAVSLTDDQWDRVLWWLRKPVPPGPAKALDESIIRAINAQRGQ